MPVRIDRLGRVLAIICLLGLGALASHLLSPVDGPVRLSFGEWIWLRRRADLLLHPALLFVGALAIRALLPSEDDSDESHE